MLELLEILVSKPNGSVPQFTIIDPHIYHIGNESLMLVMKLLISLILTTGQNKLMIIENY